MQDRRKQRAHNNNNNNNNVWVSFTVALTLEVVASDILLLLLIGRWNLLLGGGLKYHKVDIRFRENCLIFSRLDEENTQAHTQHKMVRTYSDRWN